MSETLLTPAQVAVLDQSSMRAAQIGLLQRYNEFQEVKNLGVLEAIAEWSEEDWDEEMPTIQELYEEIGWRNLGMSYEASAIFSVLSSDPDHKPYAYIHMNKLDTISGRGLRNSGTFLGRIALPGAIEPVNHVLPHNEFKDIDVYFALLRIQHQVKEGLPGIGQLPIEPWQSFSEQPMRLHEIMETWPNLKPKAE